MDECCLRYHAAGTYSRAYINLKFNIMKPEFVLPQVPERWMPLVTECVWLQPSNTNQTKTNQLHQQHQPTNRNPHGLFPGWHRCYLGSCCLWGRQLLGQGRHLSSDINPGLVSVFTHLKLNVAPENRPSQKENSLPTTMFRGRAVKLRRCRGFALPSF